MKNYEALKQQGDVIWNIANLLRGPYRPPQYRRVMIPLTVLRRLDCVLESSKDQVIDYHRKLKSDGKFDAETIETMINHRFKLNFHNTSEFTFQNLLGDADKLVANLQRLEGSLDKSMARSDEQLAYYVAQAREVIDLSISAQQGIVEDLRRLHGRAAAEQGVPA